MRYELQKSKSGARKENVLGRYLLKRVPIVRKDHTVKSVLSMLERKSRLCDNKDYVYVTDKYGTLTGVFSIGNLFDYPKNTRVREFMQTNLVTVSPNTELDLIAHLALKHDLKAIPVVKSKKLIGVISSKKIISIVNRALREDIFHFAGIHRSHLDFENSLEIPMLDAVKKRIPWLIIGLVGAMFIAVYMNFFEQTLAKYLIVVSFVPAIVYMSGALGTQLQTVFVRDLAVLGKEIHLRSYVGKQLSISSFIALIIGVLIFGGILLIWKEYSLAVVISLASVITLLVTSLTSLLSTILIKKFKFDPALGSGPIANIISDVTSVVLYFLIVVLLLG